jgi:hypothetical protein
VIVLGVLGGPVRRVASGTWLVSWVLTAIMFLNGLGHLGGSLYFHRWLPGTTSAPLLLAASLWLGLRTWERAHIRFARSALNT